METKMSSPNEKPVSPIEKLELYENLLEKNIRGIEGSIDELKEQISAIHWRQASTDHFVHSIVTRANDTARALNKKADQS